MIPFHNRPVLHASKAGEAVSNVTNIEALQSDIPQLIPVESSTKQLMRMTESAHRRMLQTLASGDFVTEQAGLLLGPNDTDIVTHFVQDEHGEATPTSFTLHTESLNEIIRRYGQLNIALRGIVHVHPPRCPRPSVGDLEYLKRLFNHGRNRSDGRFLFPIITDRRIVPYSVALESATAFVRSADLVLL